ncbi:MAG: hypothetical protein CVV50_01805 [Spirochaetae bacterium HGW-Spirochaetae-6]|nr:MAG: hypothetical protein CVV50_01805 [Spirochaetae bacterium HGW-Spirochaetae-6]
MFKKTAIFLGLIFLFSCSSKPQGLRLEETPYTYPVKTFSFQSHNIAYIDEGHGLPLIFIHGLSTTLESFAPLFPIFIKAGYRVIALDLLGYGKSAKPDLSYNLELYPSLLTELCGVLKISRPVLIGHSMGAAIAQLAALKNPDFYSALVLYTPGGMEPIDPGITLRLMQEYDEGTGKRFSLPEVAAGYYKNMAHIWSDSLEQFLKYRQLQMLHPEWPRFYAIIKQNTASLLNLSSYLVQNQPSLKLPVLALFAQHDPVIIKRFVERHLFKDSQWQLEELPGVGHMFQMENPEVVSQSTLKFLKKISY